MISIRVLSESSLCNFNFVFVPSKICISDQNKGSLWAKYKAFLTICEPQNELAHINSNQFFSKKTKFLATAIPFFVITVVQKLREMSYFP